MRRILARAPNLRHTSNTVRVYENPLEAIRSSGGVRTTVVLAKGRKMAQELDCQVVPASHPQLLQNQWISARTQGLLSGLTMAFVRVTSLNTSVHRIPPQSAKPAQFGAFWRAAVSSRVISKVSVLENSSETAEAVHRLKEEIDKLTLQQTEALKMAIYVGMTPDEATEYDERRQKILGFVQDLRILEESQ